MIQATLPRRTAPELDLNQLARDALRPWADAYGAWTDAYGAWTDGMQGLVKPRAGRPGCSCGPQACRSGCCQPDPCACRCCIADCDLLVEARVGERRIVPITIQNQWRRARDIELQLSSWTKLTDKLEVRGEIITPDKFTLAPCGEAHVILVLSIGGGVARAETTDPKVIEKELGEIAEKAKAEKARAEKAQIERTTAAVENRVILGDVLERREQQVMPDVDRCEVSYADLRVTGCDLRPIRIAVAVLPRDCDAYVADCCCACC